MAQQQEQQVAQQQVATIARDYADGCRFEKATQDKQANAPKRQTWADIAPGADTTRFGNYHMAAGDLAASER